MAPPELSLFAEACIYSSTEIAVANALKSSATDVGIHFGQSMNRRALTKWGTVRIMYRLNHFRIV